jgi:hypothetical protein
MVGSLMAAISYAAPAEPWTAQALTGLRRRIISTCYGRKNLRVAAEIGDELLWKGHRVNPIWALHYAQLRNWLLCHTPATAQHRRDAWVHRAHGPCQITTTVDKLQAALTYANWTSTSPGSWEGPDGLKIEVWPGLADEPTTELRQRLALTVPCPYRLSDRLREVRERRAEHRERVLHLLRDSRRDRSRQELQARRPGEFEGVENLDRELTLKIAKKLALEDLRTAQLVWTGAQLPAARWNPPHQFRCDWQGICPWCLLEILETTFHRQWECAAWSKHRGGVDPRWLTSGQHPVCTINCGLLTSAHKLQPELLKQGLAIQRVLLRVNKAVREAMKALPMRVPALEASITDNTSPREVAQIQRLRWTLTAWSATSADRG